MKKTRKLYKEKLNTIVQSNYVVIDIIDYNHMLEYNIRSSIRLNKLYNVLYEESSEIEKYNKIKNILLKGGD